MISLLGMTVIQYNISADSQLESGHMAIGDTGVCKGRPSLLAWNY